MTHENRVDQAVKPLVTRDGQTLTWYCGACGLPIRNGTGYIEVNSAEANRRKAASKALDRRREAQSGLAVYRAADLRVGAPVSWRAWHRRCDPEPDAAPYWIGVERVRTLPALVARTAHLMRKGWITHTDWDSLLYRVGDQS